MQTTTANLYAHLRSKSGPEIKRLRLDAALSHEVSEAFEWQLQMLTGNKDAVAFEADRKLDDDEIFDVPGYQLPEEYDVLGSQPVDVDDVVASDIDTGINGIFSHVKVRGQPVILFQRFQRSQAFQREGFINIVMKSKNEFNRLNDSGLTLQNHLDAAFVNGRLYFKSAHNIRGFLDVALMYAEATDELVRQFSRHQLLLDPTNDNCLTLCNTPSMRRRITAAMRRGLLERIPLIKIKQEASDWGLQLQLRIVSGKQRVGIPSDPREFKLFLRLLNDDCLRSRLTLAKYTVNGKSEQA